ncbi:hypothetical protein [Cellulomonas hominis]
MTDPHIETLDLTTATGVYIVRSASTSTYWVDVSGGRVMRLRGEGSQRFDYDDAWAPLIGVTSYTEPGPGIADVIRVGARHRWLSDPAGGVQDYEWRLQRRVTAIEAVSLDVTPTMAGAEPAPVVDDGPHEVRVIRRLTDALGPTITAALAGARDVRAVTVWAHSGGATIPRPAEERVRFALHVFETIAAAEGSDTARAWFLGSNPRLGGDTPVTAIREDRHRTVLDAVAEISDDPEDPYLRFRENAP